MSARAQTRPRHPPSSSTTLPPYDPPTFPLSPAARRALATLISTHPRHVASTRRHLDKARSLAGSTVADMHESLVEARRRLAAISSSRRVREGDAAAVARRDRLADHVGALERETAALGALMERSARDLVDWTARADDDVGALERVREVVDEVARRRDEVRRARVERGGDPELDDHDDEESGRVKGPLEALEEQRASKTAAYVALDAYERYARNNDYIGFKRHFHESLYGDEQPLPDPRRWFAADGRPVLGPRGERKRQRTGETDGDGDEEVQQQEEEDNDDGDDIVVDREKISFRCPLSLQVMEEPYSNSKCRHSFDRASIEAFIGKRKGVRCPQTGCDQVFSLGDFYLDEALQRKIRRVQEAERRRARRDEEDEEEEGEEEE